MKNRKPRPSYDPRCRLWSASYRQRHPRCGCCHCDLEVDEKTYCNDCRGVFANIHAVHRPEPSPYQEEAAREAKMARRGRGLPSC